MAGIENAEYEFELTGVCDVEAGGGGIVNEDVLCVGGGRMPPFIGRC